MKEKVTCPVCAYETLDSFASFDICDICFWEDDYVNRDNPSYKDGTNGQLSLWEAQKNFMEFGASDWCVIDCVKKPTNETLDKIWQPYQLSYIKKK